MNNQEGLTNVIVDWLAFTIPTSQVDDPMGYRELTRSWTDDITDFLGDISRLVFSTMDDMQIGKGRPPYNQSINFTGGMIAMNEKVDNILVEFTGIGCQKLRQANVLDSVVEIAQNRLSRLDLAVDIETSAMPTKVVENGISGRFKSKSVVQSGTGETVYIGSRKSSRYLRVYRYFSPHPRHKQLRFEFVFRKQYAKDIGLSLIRSNFDYKGAMAQCGIDYGIEHECWDVRNAAIDLNLTPPNKSKAGTMLWLVSTVAPAFKRLCKDQIITDPQKFLEEHFLS